jgi:hypothetical protein
MAMLLPILLPTQSRTAVGGVVGDFDISVHYFSAIAASVATGIAASGFITWAAAPIMITAPWFCLTVDKCYESVRT